MKHLRFSKEAFEVFLFIQDQIFKELKKGVKIVDEFIYEEVKAGLQSSKATVVFQKADGSLREMHCTLLSEYLPIFDETQTHKSKPTNEEVMAVWDLDKNDWRSFRLDSVISIDYK